MATIKSIIQGIFGLKKDPNATTQDVAVIKVEDTNAGLVLQPNGTGAIMAQVPDGTAVGGDARGQYAVDLQTARQNNYQVASGVGAFVGAGARNAAQLTYSSVVGGYENRIYNSAGRQFIGGAQYNIISGGDSAVIVGGRNNTNSRDYSSILGGGYNTISASSNYSVISGGQSNTASTNTHATVVGGQSNTSSGQYSVSGGYSNVASGQGSVALGYDNTASGTHSVVFGYANSCPNTDSGVLSGQSNSTATSFSVVCGGRLNVAGGIDQTSTVVGGRQNRAQASYDFVGAGFSNNVISYAGAICGGYENEINNATSGFIGAGQENYISGGQFQVANGLQSKGILRTQNTFAGGQFSSRGDAQYSKLIARKSDTLTTGGTTVLSLDGTGTTNLIIPDGSNRAWNVTVKWIAVVTSITGTATGVSVGDIITQVNTLGFKRVGGTSSVVGSVNTISTNNDTSMATASIGYTAGGSQELALTFTAPTFSGGGDLTIRVVAKVELTEVAY